MPFVILQDECIACGACMDECPCGAITLSGGVYTITDECDGCAACLEGCPSGAVVDA